MIKPTRFAKLNLKRLLFFNALSLVLFAANAFAQNPPFPLSLRAVNYESRANTIRITPLHDGRIHVKLTGVYAYRVRDELTAHTGGLEAETKVDEDTANVTPREFPKCKLTLTFSDGYSKLTVTQTGTDADCGFGHNVTAKGKYKLRSTVVAHQQMKATDNRL